MPNVSEENIKNNFNRSLFAYILQDILLQDILLPKIVNIHYGWASTLINYILQNILM